MAIKKKESIDNIIDICAYGKNLKEAENNLRNGISVFNKKYNIKLNNPQKVYEVVFFKGEKPGRSALLVRGETYKVAVSGAEDFDINPKDYNQEVRIMAAYALSEEEKKKVEKQKKSKPGTAGGIGNSYKTIEYFWFFILFLRRWIWQ